METNPDNLNDPIERKLRDDEAIDRLVQQAVSEAVERARKLGFLGDAQSGATTPPATH
jgi:hypothetical protein